ncbi:hypothetical protein [Halobacteriovorax sp. YZS-1-1]|uniref:hypothetical protein n=1 Tax=unclassified Halobacteriovorax TaxID=2639665 RepID=UPI00399C2CC6
MKSLVEIKRDAKGIQLDSRSASDFLSYFEFIKFFEEKDVISKNDFVIGCNFSYGWMPTILNFKNEKDEEINLCVELVNKARNSQELLRKEELEILKKVVNNSIVGVSKLLHFVSPERYPIWDSRVANYFNIKMVNDVRRYCDYLNFCHSFNKHELEEVRQIVCQHEKTFKDTSALRSLEFVFFSCGLDKSKIANNNPN